jgi:hypothetical protein
MSEIKALEELREKIRLDVNNPWSDLKGDLLAMCDKIEAEIAKRYMELPVGADDLPIRVGEVMTCHGDVFTVCAVAPAKIHRWVTVKLGETPTTYSYDPMECTHYKPRTIEDVLRDVWKEAIDYAKSDMWRNPDEAFAERADEIRELMGVDE